MKGAQVTVKTRVKKQREQLAPAAPEHEAQDQLEDPLELGTLQEFAHEVLTPPSDPSDPSTARIEASFGRYGLGGVRSYAGAATTSELQPDARDALAQAPGELAPSALKWLSDNQDDASLKAQDQLAAQTQSLLKGLAPDPHAAATERLVAELSQALGLGPVPVIHGPAASSKLGGSKGLMDDGRVFLHQGFDPNTAEGRELLAHEMVHAAQDLLPKPAQAEAGFKAEAEAGSLASRFATSGTLSRPVFGLPAGHLAADDGSAQLKSALAAYHGGLDGQKSSLGKPVGAGSKGSKMGGKENRANKVRRYRDGVDGIADKIDGLEAFSELCDTIDDGPKAYGGALRRVEQSRHFIKLSEMWQGAKDGGPDSGVMKRAFDNEFDDRGFWGSTERAYDLVARRAKAAARRKAEAEAAAKTKAQAAGKEGPGSKENAKAGKASTGGSIKSKKPGKVDPKLAALMNEPVTAELPALPMLKDFEGVTDQHLSGLVFERAHQQGLSMEASAGLGQSRSSLILDQLGDNMLGAFGKGATDQFLDSAVYDTVGKVGDKALTALTKGKFKVPFVGPAIGLIKSPPWELKNWGVTDGLGKAGAAFGGISKKMDAWGDASGTERFGLVLSAIADLMLGIGSIVEMAQAILGQLSTICYVAGGILIAVGLALLWLGVGAGLLTAGGWLVRAGGLLARINTVLGPVAFFFSTLGMVFRTAGAFFVPADMFAGELTAVGEAAADFGGKAGKKVGDKYGAQVSDKAMAKGSQAKAKAKDMAKQIKAEANGGQPAGQATGQKARNKVNDQNAKMQSKGGDAVQQGKAKKSLLQKGKDLAGATKKVVGQELGAAKKSGVAKVKEMGSNALSAAKSPLKTTGKAVAGTLKGGYKAGKATLGTVKDHFVQGAKNTGGLIKSGGRGVSKAYKGFETAMTQSPKKTISDAWSNFKKVNREMAAAGLQEVGLQDTYAKARSKGNGIEVAAKTLAQVQKLQDEVASLDQILSNPKTTPDVRARTIWKKRHLQLKQGLLQTKKNLALVAEGGNVLPQISKGDFDAVTARSQAEAQAANKKQGIQDQRKKNQDELDKVELEMRRQEQEHYRAQMAKKKIDEGDDGDAKAFSAKMQMETEVASANQSKKVKHDKKVAKLERSLEVARKHEQLKDHELKLKTETQVKIAPHKAKAQAYAQRGQKVKFGDGNGAEGTLLRISDGGKKAWVRTSQGEVQIKTSQIRNPRKLKSALNSWKQGKKDLKPLKKSTKSLKKELSGTSKKTVREVQAKLTEAKKKQLKSTARSENSNSRVEGLKEQRTKDTSGESIDVATVKMQGLQFKIDALRKKDRQLADKEGAADKEIAAAKRQAEIDAGVTDHVSGGSSGNATGGMGSVYESLDTLTNLMGEIFQLMPIHDDPDTLNAQDLAIADGPEDISQLTAPSAGSALAAGAVAGAKAGAEAAATPKAGEQVGAALDGLMDKRPDEEVQKVAGVVAATEQAIKLELSIDVDQTMEKRNKAIDALARFKGAHQAALVHYNAEQALGEVAKNTKAFADQNEQLTKKARSLRAPMLEGKQKEKQRKQVLLGVTGDPGSPDSTMASTITELVPKLASNGDEFDGGKPKVDGNSGKQIEKAHADGGKNATKQRKESTKASDDKVKFIDSGLDVQKQQETQIQKDRQALYNKHAEEMEKLQQIKTAKAQALSERNQARDEFNSTASEFLGDVSTFEAWAGQYRGLRAKVDGE